MIRVTEAQSQYIKMIFGEYTGKSNRVYQLYNLLDYKKIPLDIVTVARIVDGEQYEVRRPYQAGDIIWDKRDKKIRMVSENLKMSNTFLSADFVNGDTEGKVYQLLCKAEDVKKGVDVQ